MVGLERLALLAKYSEALAASSQLRTFKRLVFPQYLHSSVSSDGSHAILIISCPFALEGTN